MIWTYLLAIALLSIITAKWLGHGEAFGAIPTVGAAAGRTPQQAPSVA